MVRITAVLVAGLLPLGAVSASSPPDYSPPTGKVNPVVTQSNISMTICVRGGRAGYAPRLATRTCSSGNRWLHVTYRDD